METKVTCVDCGNRLLPDKTLYAMFWLKPHPDITLDDELEYNEDIGPYCSVCAGYRKLQLKQPSSEIQK